MERFDLIVIGAGSAGFAAARTASSLGAKVALIDRGPLGGLCILAGCMPSKALLRSAEIANWARRAPEFGVRLSHVEVDTKVVQERKQSLIDIFAGYRVEELRNLSNATLVEAEARFVDERTVEAGGRRYQADAFIVCAGSAPVVPPIPGLTDLGFLTSNEALRLDRIPESLSIIGGGVIAVELGQYFQRIGSKVTIIEQQPHILPHEDRDSAEALSQALVAEGMTLKTGMRISRAESVAGRKRLVLDSEAVDTEEILVATGRCPHLGPLNLGAAGVEISGGRMVVDEHLCTSNHRIYAAGDAAGKSYLVHLAIYEAEIAAYNALRSPRRQPDYRVVPSAVFTDPNVARVGMTEQEAAKHGLEVLVGRYEFADLGKALIHGQTNGHVKLVAAAGSGEILGATVVGPEGADLIHEIVAMMTMRATIEDLLRVPHVHPTLAEIWSYPAEQIQERLHSRQRISISRMPADLEVKLGVEPTCRSEDEGYG